MNKMISDLSLTRLVSHGLVIFKFFHGWFASNLNYRMLLSMSIAISLTFLATDEVITNQALKFSS